MDQLNPERKLTPQQKQDMLLHHVILPRFLPQGKSSHFHQTEIQLMHEMVQSVCNLREEIPMETVKLSLNFWKIHHESMPNQSTISTEIKALQPGNSFAMFVRRQNCMFVIHAPSSQGEKAEQANAVPQEVIVATFPGNLHPDEVYKHDSDIEVN